MPKQVTETLDLLDMTDDVRALLLSLMTDAELAYRLPGDNGTLGALCRLMGQVEQSYIDSFSTFQHSFDYPAVDPGLETSVAKLTAWYEQLDQDLYAVLQALSDDDCQNRLIERGDPLNYALSVGAQMLCYREALLIFYGRATLYLRALGKPLPQQVIDGIG
ncbi:MAG: hypothetical protein GC204_06475 [Chloroflexi bacterium]|nr:hypothetical protein [Chloroflexota bacterium]